MNQSIHIRIPDDMHAKIKALGRSMRFANTSVLIRRIIEDWLAQREREELNAILRVHDDTNRFPKA